ncbi:MAG: hypothetical protein N3I35_18285 [Clostridia bacterium]|nr:hypothetical protein [Clostridia bacterium]
MACTSGGCTGTCVGFCDSCSSTCRGECSGCGSSCSTSCGSSCQNGCSVGCGDVCSISCQAGCSGTCDGNCSGGCVGCSGTCSGTCSGSCGGCGGCTGCSGCGGACSSNCTGCSGTCSGSCTGTCSGDCNNACLSTNASSVIANLGKNIIDKGFFSSNDFVELRDAIHTELARRNKTVPDDTFIIQPASGVAVYKEHIQKVFDDCKLMDSSKTYSVNIGSIIYSEDASDSVSYIKALMTQNVK